MMMSLMMLLTPGVMRCDGASNVISDDVEKYHRVYDLRLCILIDIEYDVRHDVIYYITLVITPNIVSFMMSAMMSDMTSAMMSAMMSVLMPAGIAPAPCGFQDSGVLSSRVLVWVGSTAPARQRI